MVILWTVVLCNILLRQEGTETQKTTNYKINKNKLQLKMHALIEALSACILSNVGDNCRCSKQSSCQLLARTKNNLDSSVWYWLCCPLALYRFRSYWGLERTPGCLGRMQSGSQGYKFKDNLDLDCSVTMIWSQGIYRSDVMNVVASLDDDVSSACRLNKDQLNDVKKEVCCRCKFSSHKVYRCHHVVEVRAFNFNWILKLI